MYMIYKVVIQMYRSDKFKIVIIFMAMHILGCSMIYKSVREYQLQQYLISAGVQTQATVQECSFVRSGSCQVTYSYQVLSHTGEMNQYRVKEGTMCRYCEDKQTIEVYYLPENPQIVIIKDERQIIYIYGIFSIIVSWFMILLVFMPSRFCRQLKL